MIRALASVFSGSTILFEKAIILSSVIAVATMIVGNFLALLQEDLKRLLAYSSIAHAGYLMIGVAVAFANGQHGTGLYYGIEGILFYLVAYALMTLGAFGAMIALRIGDRPVESVNDLAGVGWAQPWLGAALAVCLLSLSGIPPLVGFWGKFEIFTSALAAQEMDGIVVPVAGDHRRAERGDRGLLLFADRGRDVSESRPGTDRDPRRLAGLGLGGGLRRPDGRPRRYSGRPWPRRPAPPPAPPWPIPSPPSLRSPRLPT